MRGTLEKSEFIKFSKSESYKFVENAIEESLYKLKNDFGCNILIISA